MDEKKHTPGPWRAGRDGTVVCDAQHSGNHLMREADLSFYDGHLLAESIANPADARLVAAAPELLEALKRIEQGCSFPSDDVQRAMRDVARAAIAKAEGKT